jgi:putative peptidoglycan lipid II flippase
MKRQTVVAGAGIMMGAALLSRVLGYARDRIIGYYFGASGHTDAYWAAFNVPDVLYYLLAGGALSAAFIPIFTRYLHEERREDAWRIANTLLTGLMLCVAVGVPLIMIFARQLLWVVVPGWARAHPDRVEECARYVRIMAPMVFFTVTSALATGILQAFMHFTWPAVAWWVYNIGIIGGALVLGVGLGIGIFGLCIGVLAGALLMVAVQWPALVKAGMRYRPRLDLSHPGVREFVVKFLPVMLGLAASQIGLLWLPAIFGSFFKGGAITDLRYANRLVILPLGIFGISISTAAFPALAAQVAAGASADFKRTLSGSLRAILFLSVPCSVGLVVLSVPIVGLLWQGGKYGHEAAAATAFALTWYGPGLLGLAAMQVMNRGFYSMQDVTTPPLVGGLYLALNFALCMVLIRTPMAYGGVAMASSISAIVGMVVLLALLRRRVGPMDMRQTTLSFGRIMAASLIMGAAAFGVSRWVGGLVGLDSTRVVIKAPPVHVAQSSGETGYDKAEAPPPPHRGGYHLRVAVQLAASMAVAVLVYMALMALMRAPELNQAWALVARQFGRQARAA